MVAGMASFLEAGTVAMAAAEAAPGADASPKTRTHELFPMAAASVRSTHTGTSLNVLLIEPLTLNSNPVQRLGKGTGL